MSGDLRLGSGRVVLRAFRPEELEQVWRARLQLHPQAPSNKERLRRRLERSGELWRGRLELAIEVDGELVGDVDARSPARTLPPGVFEIGIELYEGGARGRGHGTEAVRLLTGWLFSRAGASRIQASTDLDNSAMRRVLEKCGFQFEGVIRSFMPSAEGREDYALYALIREESDIPA